jgi:membrane associated rhomboid family serine protease
VLILKPFLGTVLSWLELKSDFNTTILQPWTSLTYAFLHYNPIHIIMNMLWLYFIGKSFLNIFNPKTALNVYFLGAISGGIVFLLGYNLIPTFFKGSAYVVGASAAVRALMIFLCAYMPKQEVPLFSFKLKLGHIGLALVAFDVMGLFGDNSGGNLAHLGGDALGYIYATQLVKGNDIGKGFEKLMDTVSSWFKPSKKTPFKKVHKNKSKVAGVKKEDFDQFSKQKKIDLILDKIAKNGYDSLTAEEKEFLFRAGK